MEQALGEGSSRRRGRHRALANKRAADSRARTLATTIRELKAAGFVARRVLVEELNRRRIPTARGGSWHYTAVVRMLTRLGLPKSGKGAAADAREPRLWLRQFVNSGKRALFPSAPSRAN
jgi:hypothetical protein